MCVAVCCSQRVCCSVLQSICALLDMKRIAMSSYILVQSICVLQCGAVTTRVAVCYRVLQRLCFLLCLSKLTRHAPDGYVLSDMCVAVCCSKQVCCSVLQSTCVSLDMRQMDMSYQICVLRCVAVNMCCTVLQCVAVPASLLVSAQARST